MSANLLCHKIVSCHVSYFFLFLWSDTEIEWAVSVWNKSHLPIHSSISLCGFCIGLCWLGSSQLICWVSGDQGDLGYSWRGHLTFRTIQPFQSPPPLFHQVTHLHDPRTRSHVSLSAVLFISVIHFGDALLPIDEGWMKKKASISFIVSAEIYYKIAHLAV